MPKFIKNNSLLIVLLLICLSLISKNYSAGTILSGWDTLHPEFNWDLNFQRIIFGTFRLEQGLGAVAGHSHMSELPRYFLLYIAHFVINANNLRYLYIFLNLIIGPLGMYFFLKKVLYISQNHNNIETEESKNNVLTKTRLAFIAYIGGVFYLLNLGTMQQFIVPFEMFTTQYAFLPWIFLFATEYFFTSKKQPLIFFSVMMFLSSPMAYAATLWYIFFGIFFTYLLTLHILSKKKFPKDYKRLFILLLTGILLNAFWILPNIYFVLTHGAGVEDALINRLFSPQAFLYNKEFSTLPSLLLQKTFLFDWKIYAPYGRFTNLLDAWIIHLNSPAMLLIGYSIAVFAILGIIYSVIKRNIIGLSLLPVLLICVFLLLTTNPPFGFIYQFLQTSVPLFKEALRFPDDKALGIYIFVFAFYVTLGQLYLLEIISKIKNIKQSTIYSIYAGAVTLILIIYMAPAFSGYLIHPYMRIQIPSYYQNFYSFMNAQNDDGIAADLPINSFWGWEYYNWYGNTQPSYQGAGFLWFGIKQPLLNRDFDRWSSYNEQYYREMSYAVYTQDPTLLQKVVSKYNIHYLILDTSIIAPENDPKILFYKQIQALLSRSPHIKKIATFKTIFVYKSDLVLTHNSVAQINNAPNVLPKTNVMFEDPAYSKFGDYISDENNVGIYFPYRNIIDNLNLTIPNFTSFNQDNLRLTSPVQLAGPLDLPSYSLTQPTIPSIIVATKQAGTLNIALYPLYPSGIQSAPISLNFPLTEKQPIISINKQSTFVLTNLSENTPLLLGTVHINTKHKNTLTVYDGSLTQVIKPNISQIPYSLSPCSGQASIEAFGITPFGPPNYNNFKLFGENTPICLGIPLKTSLSSNLGDGDLLFGISYLYQGLGTPSVCLDNFNSGDCLLYANNQTNANINQQFIGINASDLKASGIKIILDTSFSNKITNSKYSNLAYTITKPSTSADFYFSDTANNNTQSAANSVNIPYSGNTELSKDITLLPKSSGNCQNDSPLSSPGITKEILKLQFKRYIRYISKEGTLCDHVSYQTLSQNESYLITFTARNITGLPLTICATNYATRRCDLYTMLAQNKDFSAQTFLLPTMKGSTNGFDINISNLGIKGTQSINDLESIQIVPIPYSYLSNISTAENVSKSNLISLNYTQVNPDLYTVSNPKSASILTFYHSYENGWLAYSVSGLNIFTKYLPFIFGRKLNHLLVNNWANGWTINSSGAVVIIYLPQYLELIGFILLAVTFLILTIFYMSKKKAIND